MSAETIADRLRQMMPDLPTAERRVARTLLANYPVAGLETIARVASKSGTSGPTVLRLATRLGFGGYPEMQQELRDELDARGRSPLIAYDAEPPIEGDVLALAASLLGKAVTNSVGGVERSDFDRAVDMLLAPKARIVLTGGRFSCLLADYLATHLQQLRPGVRSVGMAERVPALLDLGVGRPRLLQPTQPVLRHRLPPRLATTLRRPGILLDLRPQLLHRLHGGLVQRRKPLPATE